MQSSIIPFRAPPEFCYSSFKSTSLPPLERSLADHELIRSLSRCLMKAKTCLLEPQIFSGSPKYIPIPPFLLIPSICFIAILTSCPTLLPNKIDDFDGFSNRPETLPYRLMILISSAPCWTSSLQKKRLSSAKKEMKNCWIRSRYL